MNKFKSLKVLSIVFLVFLLLLVGFDFLSANNRTVKVLKDASDTFNIVGNLKVDGKITGDGSIPSGFCIFSDTLTSCPLGWSYRTNFNNRTIRATSTANSIGNTGGTDTHIHQVIHVASLGGNQNNPNAGAYAMSAYVNHKTDNIPSWPPYITVLICCKN